MMLVQILSGIHNLTTMLYGIYISAFFLGVKQNRRNIGTLFLFSCGEGLLYLVVSFLYGSLFAKELYPFVIHLPLVIFLVLYYHYPLISSLTSVFSAYLSCQISTWVGLFALDLTRQDWCYYLSRIIATLLVFVILSRFVCRTTAAIFAKDKRELCIIGFLPLVYYIFDYATTKFSNLLYSGNKAVVEFMGFAFCIAYLIFLLVYFKEFEQKQEIRQYSDLMEIQLMSIQKEIDQVRNSRQELSILRHDMRHHLNMIQTFLQNDLEQAQKYIQEINDAYDDTVITTYSKNDTLNSVISIYQTRFTEKNLRLECNVRTQAELPCPDIAICTILSNALENAMHALEQSSADDGWAKLTITQKNHQLLLEIENPVDQIPKFVDGIPASTRKGHGIGVKSIVYYVEQLHGQYHFSVSDHMFILRIIV